MGFIHRLILRGFSKARKYPEILVYGTSAFVWAYVSRVHYSYRMGVMHGMNHATRFLESRHPEVAHEWEQFAKTIVRQ